MPPTKIRTLALAVAALVVAACGAATATTPPPASSVIASLERDGVRLTLGLESAPTSGQLSWADARIENLGTRAVRWAADGCGIPVSMAIDLRPAFDPGRDWPGRLGRFKAVALGSGEGDNPASGSYVEQSLLKPSGQVVACAASLGIKEIAPGAVAVVRAAWDGTLGGVGPAPAGPARIIASFPFIGIAGLVPETAIETRPIEVVIDAVVTAGDKPAPLSPALAIDIALADSEFAACVEDGGDTIPAGANVALINGVWYVALIWGSPVAGGRSSCQIQVDSSASIVGRRFETAP